MDQQLIADIADALDRYHDQGRASETCARSAIAQVASHLTRTGHASAADALLNRITIGDRSIYVA